MSKYWQTANGEKIPYNKLEDSHLLNILCYIERLAEKGMPYHGVCDYDGCDLDFIYDEEVKEEMDYKGLLKEAQKRGLKKHINDNN